MEKKMRSLLIVAASLAAIMSLCAAREFDYCYVYESDPYLYMGTKTAYQFVYGRAKIPPVPSCTPVQIWILARHGTRYAGREFLRRLPTLINLRNQIVYENEQPQSTGRLCNADLQILKNWRPNPNLTESLADYLTPQGEEDMKWLAKRLQSAFPEILRPDPRYINSDNFKFRSTKSQRSEASAEAFMEGLFYNGHTVPIEIPQNNDTLLRAYKNCPAWESSSNGPDVYAESEKFIQGPEYQNLIRNVSGRLGFKYQLDNDSIQLMYDMCRYDKAWEIGLPSPWCAIFSKDEMKILEYLEDLDYYYYSGPGREINEKLGCPLIKDLFEHFRNLEQGNFANEPKGIFYFAHTVTVQTLLDTLGVGKDSTPLMANNFRSMYNRSFRTSLLGSFASNLVAVFYRCSDPRSPNKVIFYLNETPVLMDGCRVGLCDWDFLKERFGWKARECSLDFCYNGSTTVVTTSIAFLLAAAGLATFNFFL